MSDERMERNEPREKRQGPRIAPSDKRTKRYSKRIILVFVLFVGLLIAAITMQAKFDLAGGSSSGVNKNYRPPQQAGFTELATSMKRDRRPVQIVQNMPPPETRPQRIVVERRSPQPTGPSLPQYYSDRDDAQAANTLRTLKLQALTSKPIAEGFGGTEGGAVAALRADSGASSGGTRAAGNAVIDQASMLALAQPPSEGDPNRQGQKQDFLRSAKGGASLTPQGYSKNLPVPRQFPYELKAGTIIPGLLLTGINSDLPGNVLAQVSENVWDVTGKHVLIPKGTRVIGAYDSQVTFGQQRVLLVWNRLVFPNGMTLDISGSPGVDQAGHSGLSGKINEHWGRMFKAALLSSVFVAGAEIVYAKDSGSFGNSERKSPRDVAAESLAGSILDMGTKVMSKASDVQPTITVPLGKKVGIFVQEDVVFPFPYL